MTWTDNAQKKVEILLAQIAGMSRLAAQLAPTASDAQVILPFKELLDSIYTHDLPLSRLLDSSDLVIHAEGPAVKHDAYELRAVNWLTATTEHVLRKLSVSLFQLADNAARSFSRELDLRLTGLVPGSLYAGFALSRPELDLLSLDEEPVFDSIRRAIHELPGVAGFIEDEGISDGIRERFPDPAQRDVVMEVNFKLAPTGQRGIHTLHISTPNQKSAKLSQRERVVLRHALNVPKLFNKKHGSFVGKLRMIDLDKRVTHLREVDGIGTLRCVYAPSTYEKTSKSLGAQLDSYVRVSGTYESDRAGKPRLMLVEQIEKFEMPAQSSMTI